jgi:threonylcarbamoyladenosine tRNA methylthiotransferase MtaB
MPAQVAEQVKKERSQRMLSLAKESAQGFQKKFFGKTLEVLWEQQANGVWSGLTGNYIKVYTKNIDGLTNRLLPVKLNKIYRDGVWGEIK